MAMVHVHVSCLTCFQPSGLDLLSVQRADSIQAALRKHFWFTEADFKQAILCHSCWEQIYNFYRFYVSVEELYQNRASYPIVVKPEPQTDHFVCVKEGPPACSSINVQVETDQLEKSAAVNEVLSEKECDEDKDADVDVNEDVTDEDEPLVEPMVKSNGDQDGSEYSNDKQKRVKRILSDDERIKKHVKYICDQCGHESVTFRSFKYHALQRHRDKSPFLVCCGKKYWKRKTLFEHVQLLKNPNKFRCKECKKNLKGKKAYRLHRDMYHDTGSGERLFKCDRCPKKFAFHYIFRQHMENHAGRWNCDECEHSSATVNNLNEHIKKMHPEYPVLSCDVCSKGFRIKLLLQNHKLAHEKQQCLICPQICQNERGMREHARKKHPNAMVCYTCKTVFPTKVALQAHNAQVHSTRGRHGDRHNLSSDDDYDDVEVSSERSFHGTMDVENVELHKKLRIVLTDCVAEGLFAGNNSDDIAEQLRAVVVKKEMDIDIPTEETVQQNESNSEPETSESESSEDDDWESTAAKQKNHESEDYIRAHVKYICEECEHESLTFKLFMEHARKVHGDQSPFLECCGKKFRRKTVLLEHIQLLENPTQINCKHCSKSFFLKDRYRRHLKHFHGNQRYQCDRCPKSFAFQYLYRQHRDSHASRWKCEECRSCFGNGTLLAAHMKRIHPNVPLLRCDNCSKEFRTKSLLQRHEQTHEQKRCIICPQMCRNERGMQKHARLMHPYAMICFTCKTETTSEADLQTHIAQNHLVLAPNDNQNSQSPDVDDCDGEELPERSSDGKMEVEQVKQYKDIRLVLNDCNSIVVKEEQVVEITTGETAQPKESKSDRESSGDEWETPEVKESTRTTKMSDDIIKGHVQYVCEKCGEESLTFKIFMEHAIEVHDDHSAAVKCCGKEFRRKYLLLKHVQSVTETVKSRTKYRFYDEYIKKHVKYICEKCGQEIPTFKRYLEHAQEVHGEQTPYFVCCGQKFRRRHFLYEHVKMLKTPTIFQCKHCSKTFNIKDRLRQHLRQVHGSKRFKCDRCPKSYATIHRLWRHKDDHMGTDDRKWKCLYCSKIFPNRYAVNDHVVVMHPDAPEYNCDVCPKKFRIESWLMEHKLKHRELKCLLCPEMFKYGKMLRAHVVKQHPGVEPPVMCTICRDVLPTKDALDDHRAEEHKRQQILTDDGDCLAEGSSNNSDEEGEPVGKEMIQSRESSDLYIKTHAKYICDKCGKESLTFKHFMEHALEVHRNRTAAVICCGKKFRRKHRLYEHVQTMSNPGLYRCVDCDRTYGTKFGYQRHLSHVHGNERYHCDQCDKHFCSKYRLNKHASTAHQLESATKGESENVYLDGKDQSSLTDPNQLFSIIVKTETMIGDGDCPKKDLPECSYESSVEIEQREQTRNVSDSEHSTADEEGQESG